MNSKIFSKHLPSTTFRYAPLIVTLLSFSTAFPQAFTKADSGWVSLFNGKNFDGLYSRMYNKEVTTTIDPGFHIMYQGTDSVEIHVDAIGGEIGSQRTNYSHYRMRVQYRFEAAGNLNAGFLYAIDETSPRMQNYNYTSSNWPRSIECQMLQGDGGDAFSIQQVTFDANVNTKGEWDPAGHKVSVCEHGCDGRTFYSNPNNADFPGPKWNDMEVVVRGSDSAIHIVNGKTVFKLSNIRITDDKGVTLKPWPSGAVGLEAEDAVIHYRRWEMMELAVGGPNYLQRLLLNEPSSGIQYAAGTNAAITWRSIGTIPKVSIYFNLGDGLGWIKAADQIPNTGTYTWKVATNNTQKLRFKISADSSVMADSSKDDNAIGQGSALRPRVQNGNHGNQFGQNGNGNNIGASDLTGRQVHQWMHNHFQFLFSHSLILK